MQEALRRHVAPGDVVYDVGANVGFFSLLAAHLGARVQAFEPLPETAAARAGPPSSTASTYRARGRRRARSGRATPSCSVDEGSRGRTSPTVAATRGPSAQLDVRTVALDDLRATLPPPALVKVDVEGSEVDVLRGMAALLHDARPMLVVELHETNDDVADLPGGGGVRPAEPPRARARPRGGAGAPARRTALAGLQAPRAAASTALTSPGDGGSVPSPSRRRSARSTGAGSARRSMAQCALSSPERHSPSVAQAHARHGLRAAPARRRRRRERAGRGRPAAPIRRGRPGARAGRRRRAGRRAERPAGGRWPRPPSRGGAGRRGRRRRCRSAGRGRWRAAAGTPGRRGRRGPRGRRARTPAPAPGTPARRGRGRAPGARARRAGPTRPSPRRRGERRRPWPRARRARPTPPATPRPAGPRRRDRGRATTAGRRRPPALAATAPVRLRTRSGCGSTAALARCARSSSTIRALLAPCGSGRCAAAGLRALGLLQVRAPQQLLGLRVPARGSISCRLVVVGEEDDLARELRLGGRADAVVELLEQRLPAAVQPSQTITGREVHVHLVAGGDEVVDGGDALGDAVRCARRRPVASAWGMRLKRMRVLPCGS